jgi:signal transduction histidine kinase
MMSFMPIRVSILFICTLDLWGSAVGVTSTTQQTIVWGWNLEPRWRRAVVSLLAAFVKVFCSGGLAYTWQWWIGYKPQSTIFHNIYYQSCKCYVSRSCLMLHYQQRTGIYCMNSVAICKGSTPSSLVLVFSSVFTDRVSFVLLSRRRII